MDFGRVIMADVHYLLYKPVGGKVLLTRFATQKQAFQECEFLEFESLA